MIYLILRSISQGRRAGVISLLGVVAGFLAHVLAAAVGMSVLFLAIFPQFITPSNGSVFLQSIVLGSPQIAVSFSANLLIAHSVAGIASWYSRNPTWLATQRYFMGFVLGTLAVRLVFEQRRGA